MANQIWHVYGPGRQQRKAQIPPWQMMRDAFRHRKHKHTNCVKMSTKQIKAFWCRKSKNMPSSSYKVQNQLEIRIN